VEVGATLSLAASARDNTGALVTGRSAQWASDSTAVATVSAAGVVRGVAVGTTRITATIDGITSTPVTVTVVPPRVPTVTVTVDSAARTVGQTARATAVVRDPNGNVVPNATVTWRSSNADVAGVAGVAALTATVTARSVGVAEITATYQNAVSRPVPVTVVAARPPTVSVTIDSTARAVGQTARATAVVRDGNGNLIPNATVVWQSSNANVATVAGQGLTATVTARSPGSAQITATYQNVASSPATVTVSGTLTVTVSGSGRVTSNPAGINCTRTTGQCVANFSAGTRVTLTAVPDTGSFFVGWTGACTGTATCIVTMDVARSVTAQFNVRIGVVDGNEERAP
jgi:hypothetical protein